jgi:hypothetical protein
MREGEGKAFFFEKKNQKLLPLGVLGPVKRNR